MITLGVAVCVVVLGVSGLIIGMNVDKNNQSKRMEQVDMNVARSDATKSDDEKVDTEEDAANNTTGDSTGKSLTMEFDGITFTVDGDTNLIDEKYEIPLESAINIGLKYIKDTFDTTFKDISVHMDTTSTSGIRNGSTAWYAVVEVDNERYEITVDALTGEVTEVNRYDKEDGSDDKWVKADTSSSKQVEHKVEKMNLDAFSDIEVNIGYHADVEIVPGDSYGVILHYYGPDYSIDYSNTDGKLTIEDKYIIKTTYNNSQTKINYVTIIVPKDSKFSNIDISDTSGDISLKDIQVDKLKAYNCSGNSSFAEMRINEGDIQTTSGDINVKKMKSNTLKIVCVSGNVEVNEIQSNEAKLISTSGNVFFNGNVHGNSTFEGTSSNIEIVCSGKEKEYSYNLETTSGSIEVNGEKIEKDEISPSVNVQNSKKNIIKVTNTSGNINIDFKK